MKFWLLELFEHLSNTEIFTLLLNLQLGYFLFPINNIDISIFIVVLGQVNHHLITTTKNVNWPSFISAIFLSLCLKHKWECKC